MNSRFHIIGFPILGWLFFFDPVAANEYRFPFGSGVHYDVHEWTGTESVISRLENNDDTIIYARTSPIEFVVKNEKCGEIYFKFSEPSCSYSPGNNGFLVDFRKDGDKVWSLFYSRTHGFYWAMATSNSVKLAVGEHWLPIKGLNVDKWRLYEVMKFRDPYPESSYPNPDILGAESGIETARINVRGNVEFVLYDAKEKVPLVDEFAFGEQRKKDTHDFWFTILKNEKEWDSLIVWNRGYKPCIIDEIANLEMNRRSGSIAKFEWRFGSKDEAIQWYRSNFYDKKAAEEIVAIIEKVYSTDKEK